MAEPSPPAGDQAQPPRSKGKTQVTVFSGFLGSGKTTVLLNCLEQLRAAGGDDYQVCWLKNEYGDVAVDSRLAAEKNIQVKEMLQGCICCTQVGKLGDALQEMLDQFQPDRILLETSGSSLPAPLARELRRLADLGMAIELDAIICVIDAVNFPGYADKSTTAKIQARFTNLLLINKHELVTPMQLDRVMDDIFELNPDTPKIQTNKGFIDYRLLLGLDRKLLAKESEADAAGTTIAHQDNDVHLLDLHAPADCPFDWSLWLALLANMPTESFYRIKGVVYLTAAQASQTSVDVSNQPQQTLPPPAPAAATTTRTEQDQPTDDHTHSASCQCSAAASSSVAPASSAPLFPHLLNHAFGRFDLTPLSSDASTSSTRVTFMGDASMRRFVPQIRAALRLREEHALRSLVLPTTPPAATPAVTNATP